MVSKRVDPFLESRQVKPPAVFNDYSIRLSVHHLWATILFPHYMPQGSSTKLATAHFQTHVLPLFESFYSMLLKSVMRYIRYGLSYILSSLQLAFRFVAFTISQSSQQSVENVDFESLRTPRENGILCVCYIPGRCNSVLRNTFNISVRNWEQPSPAKSLCLTLQFIKQKDMAAMHIGQLLNPRYLLVADSRLLTPEMFPRLFVTSKTEVRVYY